MKRLPKYTPAEVRNDPYGFTYKEMSKLLARMKQKPYMKNYISNYHAKKNLSMLVKNICKSSDTEKYVYELKDNKYIETVFYQAARWWNCLREHTSRLSCWLYFFVSPGEMALFVI